MKEKAMEFELNNIYNVDSYEAVKDIPDKSIDLVIIDPPYDIPHTTGGGMLEEKGIRNMFDNLVENDITNSFDFGILKEFDRIMKKRNIYIWCNKLLIPKLFEYYKGSLFDIISWHKTNAMPLCGSKYLTDTEYCLYFHDTMKLNTTYDTAKTHYEQPINVKDKQKYGHPTCKPVNILENLITNSSNEGDIVFDAFAGSGSTLVAAKNLNRQYLGFEIDPKWAQIASDRLNNIDATGQISLFTF